MSSPGPPRADLPGAVLVVAATTLAGSRRLAALEPVLGRSPVQRHLHHLGALGVARAVILLDPALDGPATEDLLREQLARPPAGVPELSVVHARHHVRWPELVRSADCLLIRAEIVCDSRCYPLLFARPAPLVLVDAARRDAGGGGLPVAPIGMMRVETAALGETPPPGVMDRIDTLLSQTGGEPIGSDAAVDLRTLPAYLPDLRRHLPVTWTNIRTEADRRSAARRLLDAAQKGVLDFPARFLHPVPENALVRMLAGTPVTPNAVTVLTGGLGFGATYLFAAGQAGAALALALVVNVLDGVDGKLARVRLQASRFGDRLDHLLDVSFEFSWYLALGWGLAAESPGGRSLRAGLGLIAVMTAARALSGVYQAQSGRQIHDHRAFDRGFRLVAGRRNIYVLVLVAGWLAGRLESAFWLAFWWGLATAAVYLVRVGMAWRARTTALIVPISPKS